MHEASSKQEALAQISRLNPKLIIVDINLSDGNGLEIVTWVRNLSQEIAIVVLTFSDEDQYLIAAMHAGASAFVKKSAPLSELLAAIHHAIRSPLAFTARDIAQSLARINSGFRLSNRELQILTHLATDFSLRDLASSLFISESTLKTHLTHLYRKLGVKNRLQAINLARKSGLL